MGGVELPRIADCVSWLSLVILAFFGACYFHDGYANFSGIPWFVAVPVSLGTILLCWLLVKRGISQIYILYGAVILFLLFSSKELLLCWK